MTFFLLAWKLVLSDLFIVSFFLPLKMGMSVLCLSRHCISEAHNLFLSFTGLQTRKNFSPRLIIPRVLPTPDLNHISVFLN